jgi:hypothetical protein
MYCPKCSQPQVSEDLHFCSRCGFPLDGLRMLIANEGVIAAAAHDRQGTGTRIRRGVRQGVLLTTFGFMITAILSVLTKELNLPHFIAPLVAIVSFFVGAFWVLQAVLPREPRGERSNETNFTPAISGAVSRDALPDRMTMPVGDFRGPPADTAEMVNPRSVTENTTTLFEQSGEPTDR